MMTTADINGLVMPFTILPKNRNLLVLACDKIVTISVDSETVDSETVDSETVDSGQ